MKAMILSAGLGSRMRPLTNTTPKPLLEVGGKPLIVWHLENLAKLGFKDVVVNIAYLGYMIPKALGDGEKWGLNIMYSDEQKEGGLESAGGIIKALPLLGSEPFLVVNGDIFTNYSFLNKIELPKEVLAHLILVPNPLHNPKGDFALEKGMIKDEKLLTFSGIGYYSPKLFDSISYGKKALAPILRDAMRCHGVRGELFKGEWIDIGTPERLNDLNLKLSI